mgnify:CR=1 FL=1
MMIIKLSRSYTTVVITGKPETLNLILLKILKLSVVNNIHLGYWKRARTFDLRSWILRYEGIFPLIINIHLILKWCSCTLSL